MYAIGGAGPSSLHAMSHAVDPQLTEEKPEPKKQACLGCRAIKVKCLLPPGAPLLSRCTRCIRLDWECSYHSAPRGRKPKIRSSITTSDGFRTGLPGFAGADVGPHGHSTWANLLPQTLPQLPRPVLPHSAPSSTLAPPNPAAINMLAADSSPGSQASPSTGGIPPSPSLRDNSLASLVEAAEAKSAPAPEARPRGVPQDIYSDPINLHVLSLLDAQQLVSYFHVHLNPFIILFDRRLHTLEHLRATSGVLFTAILAVSAKFFARHLYPSLLSHANQLVTRGMSGGHSHIGLVQALCLLVYWKEPEDNSAWLRVGVAIRLAYQLRLHTRRLGPLPADETQARIILDRERTWLCLICFDHSYHLHDDSDGQRAPLMTSTEGLNLDKWLEEDMLFDCAEDVQLAASIEICNVTDLLSAVQSSISPAASAAIAGHLGAMLNNVFVKYLSDHPAPSHRLPSPPRLKFTYLATFTSLRQAYLVATGMRDDLILAEYLSRAAELVACTVEIADTGLLRFLQDTIAVSLYKFIEFLSKLFPLVGPANQHTIASWMTQIYNACNRAKGDSEEGVAAILSRFFALAIRAVSISNSLPPTRPGSPRSGSNEEIPAAAEEEEASADSAAAVPLTTEAPVNPFDGLGLQDDVNLHAEFSQGALADGLDTAYWESVFPGYSSTDWSWLDPAPMPPVLPLPSQAGMADGVGEMVGP